MRWGHARRLAAPVLFLVAALVWLRPLLAAPGAVPFWPGGAFSDLLLTHIPNALYLRRSVLEWRQIPLWNASILSGAPFAADPLSGLTYPPTWLAAVLPPALAFNLLFWLHLAWAGLGAWSLAKVEGLEGAGAWLAGLAFAGTPKLIGQIGLGHAGLVFAVCWTPWLVLAAGRAADAVRSAGRRRLRWPAAAGALLGLVFLIDPRWALPSAGLAGVYALARIAHSHEVTRPGWRAYALAGLGAVTVAAGVAGGLAIPLGEYLPQTTRAGLGAAEAGALSLPPAGLLGVFVPTLGGWPETFTYAGLAVVWLAVVAVLARAEGAFLWGGVALAGWLLALGPITPFYRILILLVPGSGLLRVPPRWLFVTALALSMLAGKGLSALMQPPEKHARRFRLASVGFVALVFCLAAGIWIVGGGGPAGRASSLGAAILAAGVLASMVYSLRSVSVAPRAAVWLALAVADLAWAGGSLLEAKAWPAAEADSLQVAAEVSAQSLGGRTFSPSYSLPQQVAALEHLELADGVNPLQLATYVGFMAHATGFDLDGYSVTLPPFPSGDPSLGWSPRLRADQLGLLSVEFVTSAYPLAAEELVLLDHIGDHYLYRNERVRPRAWVQEGRAASVEDPWRAVESLLWSPNHISVVASGPGTLVLSEIAYPGWRAKIDGGAVPLGEAYGLLRAVDLPPGKHHIEVLFRPLSAYLGAVSSLAGLLVLAWAWRRG